VLALAAVALALGLASGCTRGPDTTYAASSGASLNGSGAWAGLLRRQGHQVRFSRRLTDELAGWAQVIVRFAAIPGPPDREEAAWYIDWLESGRDRDLIYVVRDYNAEAEYWDRVLARFSPETDALLRAEAEDRRNSARAWVDRLPEKTEEPADSSSWFAVDKALGSPAICKKLGGLWGHDLDPAEVALPVHEPIAPGSDHVLLSGDGHPLVVEWHVENGGNVLVVANGSFLLNLPLAIPARRPLAERTARWIGDEPRRIAFVSGSYPFGGPQGPPGLIEWITEDPTTRWVALQLALFGLIACLARAPILGRPRPEPAADVDRPAAHAEALGALLERGKNAEAARNLLAAYRRWRFPRAGHETGQDPVSVKEP
jgi:hypothetical protein